MTLLTRIARLFKADLHGILDSLEEPEIILKQSIREMEAEIAESEQRRESLQAQSERLAGLQVDLAHRLDDLETQIDLCFEQTNESLARALIRRKLETRERIKALASRGKTLEAERALGEKRLSLQREQLKAILEKQALFSETKDDAADWSPDAEWGSGMKTPLSDEEIEVAFLQEKKRRMQGKGSDSQAGEST